ncbi:MAG: GNAT family N-acetyltransferase [Hyphomicrobiaceae bacterium]
MPSGTDLELRFREAKVSDMAAIVALLADDPLGQSREDAGTPINPKYLDAFAAMDRDINQLLAVVELAGDIVGCLQLSFIPGLSRLGAWRGQIESVRISSAHRGLGLGHTMFTWAIEQCRARGCELVQLTTDKKRPDALRFYESLGFVASHDGMKLAL